MLNEASRVGATFSSLIQFSVPNVEKYYPGQGAALVQETFSQLQGLGVPGAQGLLPKTPVLGGQEIAGAVTPRGVGGVQNSGQISL